MFAVIKQGGKQYKISEGDKIKVDRMSGKEGDVVSLTDILLLANDKETKIGKPFLEGVAVKAKILKEGKGKKVITLKYKKRKNYRRKIGFRRTFTEIQITKIGAKAALTKKVSQKASSKTKLKK